MPRGKNFPINLVLGLNDKASSKFKRATSKMQAQAQKLKAVGKSLTGMGKRLTVGLTLPVLGFGVAAAKAAAEFEKGMGNVSTLVDTNRENMAEMGAEVLKIAKTTPVAISSLTEALYDVRSAGIDAGSAMGVLKKSAELGVVGLGTTKESVDLVTSAINAWGLKGEEAERIYGSVFATVKAGKTTISQLSTGFGAVAGTMAANGVSVDEYLSSVAALTTVGLKASEAHTQLKAVVSGLTRETTQSKKVFSELGAKNLPDLIKKSGGLVPALSRIKNELGGDIGAVLKLEGSTEALNATLGLTGKQAETQRKALASMQSGAEQFDNALKKQTSTASARFAILKNNIEASAIGIGKALLPIAEKIAAKIQKIIDKFEGLDEDTKTWIATSVLVAAAIGPVLVAVGMLITAFQALKIATIASKVAMVLWKTVIFALKAALLILRGAMLAVNIVFLLNPIVLIAFAIAAAAALIILNWKPIKAFFKRLWDDVLYIFDQAMAKIGTMIKTAREAFAFITGGEDPNDKDARLDAEAKARAAKNPLDVDGRDAAFLAANTGGKGKDLDLSSFSPAQREAVTKVQVDFANAPKGTVAGVVSEKGPAKVDLSMGQANSPG